VLEQVRRLRAGEDAPDAKLKRARAK